MDFSSPSSQQDMHKHALTVSDLRVEYKISTGRRQHSIHAVNGLSFHAAYGQVTALLGPNGAGKTTTLECSQGLLEPTAGSVKLLGENPWKASPDLRARMGVMLQDGGLPQSARPGEFLQHVSAMYRHPANMTELMDMLGISAFAKTPLRRLSGGQRQRVALAAALAGNPEIVFLDEPSAGLDPQSRAVVFDLIVSLKERGVAVLLTTHLLDDAQKLADYVVIMDQGVLQKSGTVAELVADDDKTNTLQLQLTPSQYDRWLSQPPRAVALGHKAVETKNAHHQITITGNIDPDFFQEIITWFTCTGELPMSLSLQPRTLEEVFLSISGREIR